MSHKILHTTSLCFVTLLWMNTVSAAQQRGQQQRVLSAREAAPIDLTGYWVPVITEDWRWRMLTPPKGDFFGVPLNDAGVKVLNGWDPAKDQTPENQCRAYGAAGIMRLPLRVHITWVNDNTLKIETDAGQQTRLLHFADAAPSNQPSSLQGYSDASWEIKDRRGQKPEGNLKVVTTRLKPGYLRTISLRPDACTQALVFGQIFRLTYHANKDQPFYAVIRLTHEVFHHNSIFYTGLDDRSPISRL